MRRKLPERALLFMFLLMPVTLSAQTVFTSEYEISAMFYLRDAERRGLRYYDVINVEYLEYRLVGEETFSGRVFAHERFFIGGSTSTVVSRQKGAYTFTAHKSTIFGDKFRLVDSLDKSFDRIGIRYRKRMND